MSTKVVLLVATAALLAMVCCGEDVVMMDDSLEHESLLELRNRLQQESAMDRALKMFHRARNSRSRADLHELLQSLLQVAEETAPSEAEADEGTETAESAPAEPAVVHDWTVGSGNDGAFGVWLEGKPRMLIDEQGEVWGSERQGYFGNWTDPVEGDDKVDLSQTRPKTSVQSGDWKLSDTDCGCLGFYYKGKPVIGITADGRLWSESKQAFALGTDKTDVAPDWVPQRFNLEHGETHSTGTWRYGETTSGVFAFFAGDTLAAAMDRFGEVYTAAEGMITSISVSKELNTMQNLDNAINPTDTDCVLNEWSPFGMCSKQCGGGLQSRVRTALIQPSNNGAQCGPLEESRDCNTNGCAVDCEMGAWGQWSACDKSCGVGAHHRKREVLTYPSSEGKQCPPIIEKKPCNTQACGAEICTEVDAVASYSMDNSDEAFIFAGSKIAHWDLKNNSVVDGGSATEIKDAAAWNLLPDAFRAGIDAAINLQSHSTQIWLVKGTSLLQWDLETAKPVGEVAKLGVSAPFDKLPHPFDGRQPVASNASKINTFIDAAVLRQQGTSEVYLFQGNQYLLYDFETEQALEGPASLDTWNELPPPFNTKIDAAVNRRGDTSEVFFFSGDEFLRWDINDKTLYKPQGGPYRTALHGQFSGLGLNTCSGFDLNNIGSNSSLVRQISHISPKPLATENVIAGTGWPGYADNQVLSSTIAEAAKGCGRTAAFDNPMGVALLGLGSETPFAYVVDSDNHAIRRVSLTNCNARNQRCKPGNVTTVAGGAESAGFLDGPGGQAAFFNPRGISGVRIDSGLNPGDLLYVADTGNSAIRRVFVPKGTDAAQVLTAAGGGDKQCAKCKTEWPKGDVCTGCCKCSSHGFADEIGTLALFDTPTDVALLYEPESRGLGSNEYIYVTDAKNHAIRRVVVKPGIEAPGQSGHAFTIAGMTDQEHKPMAGFADGNGASAMFSCVNEEGLAACGIDAIRDSEAQNDILYVADTHNNALRRIVVPMPFSEIRNDDNDDEKETETATETEDATAPARKLLSEVLDLEADVAPPPPRFTAAGGTAPKDMQCNLPFLHGGLAHNDCIRDADPDMGITAKMVQENGWCPSGDPKNPEWAPCQPVGYTPQLCVMSPWSVFAQCSVPCGGGVQLRTRTIEIEGNDINDCPPVNDTRPCAQFECGQVSTVAGGDKPFGTLEDGITPDNAFFPQSVSVHVNGYEDDVVYLAGDPQTSAQLKRAEVKRGVVDSEGDCGPEDKHMAAIDPEIEGGKCAMPMANAGNFAGLKGLAVASEQLVIASTSQHVISGLDLTLDIECEPWLSSALNHWDSDPDATGIVKQTNQGTVYLTPTAGFVNKWQFTGYRRVLSQPELKFGSGNMAKNVMCYQEQARPTEGITTSQRCCVTKSSPRLERPTLCSFLKKLGATQECSASPSPTALDQQKQAECEETVCVNDSSGPGSSAWTQAEAALKISAADYIAEHALLAQKLQSF